MFYFAYILILSKETLFKLNRLVILSIVLASIILPAWTLTITKEVVNSKEIRQETFIGDVLGVQLQPPKEISAGWVDFLPIVFLFIFLMGAMFVSLKNLYGVLQISRIIKNSRQLKHSDLKIYISNKEVIPFSWFRSIIISSQDYNTNAEVIIEHERAHIHLKHNYDLLLINTVVIFQWFNPIFWLLRKELIAIHEYQADNRVLKNGIDARKYQYLLISKGTMLSFSIPVVNHLCSGNFQKRIKMMLKEPSSPNRAIKVLLLIPLLALAIAAFAKTNYVTSTPDMSLKKVQTSTKNHANEEFPESLTFKIPKFVIPHIIYPEEAKKSSTNGEFFVRIKSEKGEVKRAEVIDIRDDSNTPRCEPLIVTAYGKTTG